MKTVKTLKNAVITVNGEVKETITISNPCQMWKGIHGWAEKYNLEGVRILVLDTEDKPYKDFTVKTLKNGKYYLVNSVRETNRWMQMKARGIAPIKRKAKPVEKTPEEIEAEKIAAKKAKKAAYDKARRARIKAEKAAAIATTQVID